MEKEEISFNKRAKGHGPFVVGTYAPGDKICTDIEIGNCVSLETDDVTILVDITDIAGTKYKGKIRGFENYQEEFYKGYAQGDDIDFEYDEIHGCIRQ
jgi:hypothetical protein